ncbi:MAG TPA: extracellular solute-binding protein [Mycobacteriales bacterium]|nr:extracellular solute-binding protein [Mycobacteriales bacterium]
MPTRRQVLQGIGAAVALSTPLAACSREKDTNSAAKNEAVTLPAYVPYRGVKADLPSTTSGLLAGYFRYPAHPAAAVKGKPAAGLGEVSAMSTDFAAIAPAVSRNQYWQELNRRLGADLKLSMVPSTDYDKKISTVVASGDVPDIMGLTFNVPHRAEMLKAVFADLTEYLSGDNIKEFPFLANIPTESWKPAVYNGGIYALPTPRPPLGNIVYAREDIIAQKGLNNAPKNYEEFQELCVGLTDERSSHWAMANPGEMVRCVQGMLGAPNNWAEKGGKFTNAVEVEETKQALSLVRELVKKKVFHPDSFTLEFQNLREMFGAGTIALNFDGFIGWTNFVDVYAPDIGGIVPPLHDGGGYRLFAGPPSLSITAIKKNDGKKVRQLLEVCNWLAAPFGTQEYLFRKFGTEGNQFRWTDGHTTPQLTESGSTQVTLPLQYLVDAPVILGPGREKLVRKQYDFQRRAIPAVVKDASTGLYSDTATENAADLGTILTDAQTSILQGRKPVSSWDDAVSDWRSKGGDTIRKELEQAYQHAH